VTEVVSQRDGSTHENYEKALNFSFSAVPYVFSFRIFGDLENYTFLETLGPNESEKQCLHFSKHSMAAILDFQNGDCFF